ncbi:MAG: glycosyltransferase [Verrucomicrobia bacterium]|nr:glycosyltransferase [Verrucomicrobiota bacterium]
MDAASSPRPRVTVDGKFFRLGGKKFYVKGVTYGPFGPEASGFASPAQTRLDFVQLQDLGANVLRIYHPPPRWFLDLAEEHGLKLLVDVPWAKHLCFLDSEDFRGAARAAVKNAVTACAGHPAVFAFSVVNEIPPDVVRWTGAAKVGEFIDELVDLAKSVDPECLCTFANFPPTEFLQSASVDFLTFNVYLHQQRPLENYLARLQMIADTKPLMLGEFGIDTIREGEPAQGEILAWQIEAAFRGGLAGTVVYSYTDEWFKDGIAINDWAFGLTTRNRVPKPAFAVVKQAFATAPHFPLPSTPKVSVVVASYNGGKTLKACLDSLGRLNYPNCEIILVDDGSTDATPQIASLYPKVRTIRQVNKGLSVARNTGINAATGEIVAFTDSDCRADEDWLYYLVGDLLRSRFIGIGGHNFLPPEDSPIAACVMVSPGGPAHVMLNDRVAEHIPGCNMAFWKWALDEIGGFDAIFRKAGDDVDVCWRLQQHGYRIGFSAAGFVWHYRRSTARAYLKQQAGYGEAEALLVRKHPEYFNSFGASIWRGRIYTAAKLGVTLRRDMIYHGIFGSGLFQSIYAGQPNYALMFMTSLEYHVLVTLPLLVLSVVWERLLPLGLASFVASIVLCIIAAAQANLPKRKKHFWSRPLVALLFFLQPIERGWARYKGRLKLNQTPLATHASLDAVHLKQGNVPCDAALYWAETWIERFDFLNAVLKRLDKEGWQNKTDEGWSEYDVEISGSRWCDLQLTTVAESHGRGRQLFRCRLATQWSLLAKLAFWSSLGFELLLSRALPWWASVPLIALTVLTLWFFFHSEEQSLKRLVVLLLDGVGKQLKLVKIETGGTKPAVAATKTEAKAETKPAPKPEVRLHKPEAKTEAQPAAPKPDAAKA